jgi:hypothetical protein
VNQENVCPGDGLVIEVWFAETSRIVAGRREIFQGFEDGVSAEWRRQADVVGVVEGIWRDAAIQLGDSFVVCEL